MLCPKPTTTQPPLTHTHKHRRNMSISPEFKEIGRSTGRKFMKAPEKSNFSQTCNLLSQYLKEKGGFGDLGFGTGSPRDIGRSAAMDLFPQHTGFGTGISTEEIQKKSDSSEIKKLKATQMTIIYNGKVVVFDDISGDKVKELMVLASNGNLESKIPQRSPELDLNSVNKSVAEEPTPMPIQAHLSGLPLARKASLHRFLEKRKDRINARAPYQVNVSSAAAAANPEESNKWFAVASIGLTL